MIAKRIILPRPIELAAGVKVFFIEMCIRLVLQIMKGDQNISWVGLAFSRESIPDVRDSSQLADTSFLGKRTSLEEY